MKSEQQFSGSKYVQQIEGLQQELKFRQSEVEQEREKAASAEKALHGIPNTCSDSTRADL